MPFICYENSLPSDKIIMKYQPQFGRVSAAEWCGLRPRWLPRSPVPVSRPPVSSDSPRPLLGRFSRSPRLRKKVIYQLTLKINARHVNYFGRDLFYIKFPFLLKKLSSLL